MLDPGVDPVPALVVATAGRDEATGGEGRFRFTAPTPGVYEIQIRQDPFKPIALTVEATAAAPFAIRIGLELAEVRNKVTVTGDAHGP